MGLITGLLGLPLAPLRGTIAVAEQVRRQAEEEFYDPARSVPSSTASTRQRDTGVSATKKRPHWEDELLERLMVARTRPRKE